jgi:hypothetical protein
MGYGQGDYGQGDYDQGDLWGFIKGVGKAVLGAVPGGSIITGAIGAIGALGHPSNHPAIHLGGSGMGSVGLLTPALTPGGTTSSTDIGYGLFHHTTSSAPAGGPSGSHMGYHQVRKGKNAGKWVRNRHMNVTNPKALRRAIRRGHGFEKLARRMLGFATPHKPKGRVYFKRKTGRR